MAQKKFGICNPAINIDVKQYMKKKKTIIPKHAVIAKTKLFPLHMMTQI